MTGTPPRVYEQYDIELVREQLAYCRTLDFYENRLDSVADSWKEFRELPFMNHTDLLEDVQANPPYGSLFHEDTRFTCLTPSGQEDLMMEFMTGNDLDAIARTTSKLLSNAGIEEGDTVISCFSYTPFAAGYLFHIGLEELGVNILPLGPGNAKQTATIIDSYSVDALVSAPSFASDIAAKGGVDIETVVCAGEPFSAIPGYKDSVVDAFDGATVVDYYGVSEVGPIACEGAGTDGMVIASEYLLVEVLDPNTQEPVAPSERGELVVTHLDRESQPLVRYRTGDLTSVRIDSSGISLPDGVFGRVDDMVKVKGVKLYPSQITLILHGVDGLTGNAVIQVDRPGNTDRLRLVVEGDENEVNGKRVSEIIQTEVLVSLDELVIRKSVSANGVIIEDSRYG